MEKWVKIVLNFLQVRSTSWQAAGRLIRIPLTFALKQLVKAPEQSWTVFSLLRSPSPLGTCTCTDRLIRV